MVSLEEKKTFLALKYGLVTKDRSSWPIAENYPFEVTREWVWKCAEYLEPLAKGYVLEESLIAACKKLRGVEDVNTSEPNKIYDLMTLKYREKDQWGSSDYHKLPQYRGSAIFFNAVGCDCYNTIASALSFNSEYSDMFLDWLYEALYEYETDINNRT